MAPLFFCVDIESDGPIPGPDDYSMSQIGAVVVGHPELVFEIKLRPISAKFDPVAAAISGLDRQELIRTGVAAGEAMRQFGDWIVQTAEHLGGQPVFVGNNAPYDSMFVTWYFHHYLGVSPFGHNGLDIRSYAMGSLGLDWPHSSLARIPEPLRLQRTLSHDGLDDARQQAECFMRLQAERANREEHCRANTR